MLNKNRKISSRSSREGMPVQSDEQLNALDHAELLNKVRRIHIRTRHMVSDLFAGKYHSVFKGQGMEFDEVREYQPGDEIRSIDWNVTARMGYPYIKKFVEERELTVMLMVDISASHHFGSSAQLKQDLAAEVAAVLAFAAIQNNDRVGLILFAEDVELYVPPKKGLRHVLRLIREVLYFKPRSRGTRLSKAIDFHNHVTARRSVTFLISDFIFNEDIRPSLSTTARRHDLVGIIIGDKREMAWPKVGLTVWQDAESGDKIWVDTSSRKTRTALEAMHREHRRQLRENLIRWRVDPIEIYAGEPYEFEFIKFFQMRERRLSQ